MVFRYQPEFIGWLLFVGKPRSGFSPGYVGEVAFIYVAGLAKPYRGTGAFREGLSFTVDVLQRMGVRESRFHAAEWDARNNGIYSRFANLIGKEENGRGYDCNLYASGIDELQAYLGNGGA